MFDRGEDPRGGVSLALEVAFGVADVDQVRVGGVQRDRRAGGGVDVSVIEVVRRRDDRMLGKVSSKPLLQSYLAPVLPPAHTATEGARVTTRG